MIQKSQLMHAFSAGLFWTLIVLIAGLSAFQIDKVSAQLCESNDVGATIPGVSGIAEEECPPGMPPDTPYWYDPSGPVPEGMGSFQWSCHGCTWDYYIDGLLPAGAAWPADYNHTLAGLHDWDLGKWDGRFKPVSVWRPDLGRYVSDWHGVVRPYPDTPNASAIVPRDQVCISWEEGFSPE